MEKSSTEQQIFKKREIAVSDQPSPNDKPQAHRKVVYSDTHRELYREVNQQVYQVDQDSTEVAYQNRNHEVDQMVTEADFKR
jgi:hypothetical protein